MKKYFKEINGKTVYKTRQQIVITKNGMSTYNPTEEMVLEDGWMEYVQPTLSDEDAELKSMIAEIKSLKTLLSNSDYKVIKCMEAMMVGGEIPYDMAELHTERQSIRDRINEIENSLSSM